MGSKLSRRDLLKYVGCTSTLAFVPGLVTSAFAQGQQLRVKPRIRTVVRLQMYAGWDVTLGVDPPSEARHRRSAGGKSAWLTQWNFPSGRAVGRGSFSFGDGASANVEQAAAMETQIQGTLGTEYFSRLDRGLRAMNAEGEFAPISGAVGTGSGRPFDFGEDYPWAKTHPQNPSVRLGPLMHQLLETFDKNPSTGAAYSDRYADHMTVINGIDTGNNVSHDAGAVLTATGFLPPGVGNGADLTTLSFRPSFEAMMAHELVDRQSALTPSTLVEPALVPLLTFTYPGFRRGYVSSPANTRAPLFDVTSLKSLGQRTTLTSPLALAGMDRGALAERLLRKAEGGSLTREAYGAFHDILGRSSLGLEAYGDAERRSFDGMLELILDKADTNPDESSVPPVRLRHADQAAGVSAWRRETDPQKLRRSLNAADEGSWQANLATAAMMVRKGYTRGVAVSFGGHVNFIPDTHWHNDYVQTLYQGIFWDGVRRFLNYLRWNNDEAGRPLLESTLVVVASDIVRGPVYFDQGVQGRSDYRNNAMVLFGGGLNHKTKLADGSEAPGRVIGYSHGELNSGRIDLATGAPTAIPGTASERIEEAVTHQRIYASLMSCYGIDVDKYYRGVSTIGPLAKNDPAPPNEVRG